MSSGNSKLLVSCKNKSGAEKHYLPALVTAGWTGPTLLVAPGDPVPDLAGAAGLLLTGGQRLMRWWLTQVARRKSDELFMPSLCIRRPRWTPIATPSSCP